MDKGIIYKIKRIMGLVFLTVLLFAIYYFLFHNSRDIFTSIVMNIASIPLNMLVTGYIFNEILNKREKAKIEKEINMLIGIFFNEVGTEVLRMFVNADDCIDDIRDKCIIKRDFDKKDYENLMEIFLNNNFCARIDGIDLFNLKMILNEKSNIIIDLISNTILKEKEGFTDAVISVLHLRDELNTRFYLNKIEYEYEKKHLEEDINISYRLIAVRWVNYIEHLGAYYPQLFTKALISSPFDNRDLETKDEEYLKK